MTQTTPGRGETTQPRRVTILGSTGSVGCNTIDLIERQPDAFQVEALTAYSNVARLAEQAPDFLPILMGRVEERQR